MQLFCYLIFSPVFSPNSRPGQGEELLCEAGELKKITRGQMSSLGLGLVDMYAGVS